MSQTVHIELDDIDNVVLQRLCGVLDGHLTTLAKALEIDISRRFGHFTLVGKHAHAGKRALLSLVQWAEHNELDEGIIQLHAVEAKSEDAQFVPKTEENMAYFFYTKRGQLGGRTPRQNGYIRALLNHDVVFGLGPAGTGKTYLAVAAAVDAMHKRQVERIV